MGYLNVKSFIYDGVSSEAYGLGIGWLKSDNRSSVNTGLAVDIKRGEMNMVRTEPNQYGVVYNNPLQFEFGIFKRDHRDFTYEASRRINRWLRGSSVYKRLYFEDENPEAVHFYAICTDIVDVTLSGITMKKLTFICNSPFGYLAEVKKKISSTSSWKSFRLLNQSDHGVYYPRIQISAKGSYTGQILIENQTEGKTLTVDFSKVSSVDSQKTLILDGKRTQVTDQNGTLIPVYKIGWDDPENIYWVRLTEENNMFRVKGTAELTMFFEFPRKVGVV